MTNRYNEFTFIGLGSAGGNVADLAYSKGFIQTIVINYSQSDLQALDHLPQDRKHRIIGSDGLGHNREEAGHFLEKNPDSTIEFLQKYISPQNSPIAVITFACGGGSGSGLAPIIYDLVKSIAPEQIIIMLPILPDTSEVLFSQYNTLSLLNDISSFDCCVLPLDNQQMRRKGVQLKSELYSKINEKCVQLFENVAKSTQKYSKIANFDKKDMMNLFRAKGFATLSNIKIMLNKNHYLTNEIQMSWNNNIFTPINKSKILKAGIITNGLNDLNELINYKKMFSLFQNQPFDIFEGIYASEKNQANITTILTGLSPITKRIAQIQNLIKTKSDQANHILSDNDTMSINMDKVNFVQQLKSPITHSNANEPLNNVAISQILKKYTR